ncbi:MAG: glutamyl-tRNA reductase [Opitutales bacterium]
MSDLLQRLFVIGSSHHETPLHVRESFALSREAARILQEELRALEAIRECMVLTTCNRLEIYGLATGTGIETTIHQHIARFCGVDRELIDRYFFRRTNLDVLQHAVELASGLDSQMVGETEILAQMKEAYSDARASNAVGNVLNRIFQKSFQAAKAVRSRTAISQGQVSIGNVAVDLARRIFGKLETSRILLTGSGEVAEKTAQALKSAGVADIMVTSRTFENAHQLAHKLGGAAIEFDDFPAQAHRFDIIISSTSAHHTILSRSMIRKSREHRPERPFFLLDLALPRDIEPSVEQLENVYLYNLDDLSTIANENLELRRAEIEHARTILKGHAWRLWLHLRRHALQQAVTG